MSSFYQILKFLCIFMFSDQPADVNQPESGNIVHLSKKDLLQAIALLVMPFLSMLVLFICCYRLKKRFNRLGERSEHQLTDTCQIENGHNPITKNAQKCQSIWSTKTNSSSNNTPFQTRLKTLSNQNLPTNNSSDCPPPYTVVISAEKSKHFPEVEFI